MAVMRRLPLFPAPADDAAVRTLLDLPARDGAALRAGSVQLAPGQRVPGEGLSRHGVAELSLIVAGSLRGESGGEPFEVAAGDVTLIPEGEPHWAVAGPDGAEIFWTWFGDVEREG